MRHHGEICLQGTDCALRQDGSTDGRSHRSCRRSAGYVSAYHSFRPSQLDKLCWNWPARKRRHGHRECERLVPRIYLIPRPSAHALRLGRLAPPEAAFLTSTSSCCSPSLLTHARVAKVIFVWTTLPWAWAVLMNSISLNRPVSSGVKIYSAAKNMPPLPEFAPTPADIQRLSVPVLPRFR